MRRIVFNGPISVWSDPHFNHYNIIKLSNRPYSSLDEMNDALIGKWNSTVGNDDLIICLGDFGYPSKRTKRAFRGTKSLIEIFHSLNGRKHLVLGNHDEKCSETLHLPWETISDMVWIHKYTYDGVGPITAQICHYPIESWRNMRHGSLMIHGHCHGNLYRTLPHRFDTGCDVLDTPVRLTELAKIAAAQEIPQTDHHGVE